ncbi:MAG: hypothetical protein J7K02_05945 [Deltaproteobacteria bacterium]|nr:hypothetical protein [Deltaproteobacteria bacterium]MCD6265496.1 hypothetical protein [Deltaproteobacteria bacterium]
MSIAQVRVGDYMEGCEVFFNNTLISVKTIHAIKGKTYFQENFVNVMEIRNTIG